MMSIDEFGGISLRSITPNLIHMPKKSRGIEESSIPQNDKKKAICSLVGPRKKENGHF